MRVAPGALLAVHLAERVVQQHVGRARAVGTGVVAHHRVEAEGRLDRLALEPAIQETARAFGEQVQQVAPCAPGTATPAGRPGAAPRSRPGRPSPRLGGVCCARLAQNVADFVKHGVIGRQCLGIAMRRTSRTRPGCAPARRPVSGNLVPSIGRKLEIGRSTMRKPWPCRPHVGDHLRIEQADRVAGHRVAEARDGIPRSPPRRRPPAGPRRPSPSGPPCARYQAQTRPLWPPPTMTASRVSVATAIRRSYYGNLFTD